MIFCSIILRHGKKTKYNVNKRYNIINFITRVSTQGQPVNSLPLALRATFKFLPEHHVTLNKQQQIQFLKVSVYLTVFAEICALASFKVPIQTDKASCDNPSNVSFCENVLNQSLFQSLCHYSAGARKGLDN